jgi:hypothetical protein
MYSLKVVKDLKLENGTFFKVGHDVNGLNAFEVSLLIIEHPKHFEPADDLTKDFTSNKDNMKHLANAAKK